MPASLAAAGNVDDAAARAEQLTGRALRRIQGRRDRLRDHPRRSWRADLVGDDAELLALFGETDDCVEEIGAARGLNPRRPHDQMRGRRSSDRLVAGELARAIDR